MRPNGAPLYTLVNPVDDALMGITHALRGEDLLSSTPRQIALYHALIDIGVTTFVPRFGHEHRLRAAFGTEPGPVHRAAARWNLPRCVAGQHWKDPLELDRLLDTMTA